MQWDIIGTKVAEHGIPLALACIAIVYLWKALEAERAAHIKNLLRILDVDDTSPK